MDELDERIALLEGCGFVDKTGAADLHRIADILVEECGVSRDDEVLGTLVTHVAAALKRARDGEKINPLSADVINDVKDSAVYPEALRIQQRILDSMVNDLSADERDFVLVHVGGLLLSRAVE